MSQNLTIVMYHYVRDQKHSRFPRIKGRDLSEFNVQLDYICHNYTVVTAEQVMEAALGGEPLPLNSCWLTFDDGYQDHHATVFPLLLERGLQGSFFPPAQTAFHNELLDVNKVHFILAAVKNPESIFIQIQNIIHERHLDRTDLRDWDWYLKSYHHAEGYDTADIILIKRILQKALPEDLRNEICDMLFAKYVSADTAAFASELYMSSDQLRDLIEGGMYVGSHGSGHCWLDELDITQKETEIDSALEFLRNLGIPTNRWVMCYPYGAYDPELLEILHTRKCTVGITTRPAVANLESDPRLELPRVDTNELPTS